jgi:hypothetical protein
MEATQALQATSGLDTCSEMSGISTIIIMVPHIQ